MMFFLSHQRFHGKTPNLFGWFFYNTKGRKEAQREIQLATPLFIFDSLSQYYPSNNGGYWGKLSFLWTA